MMNNLRKLIFFLLLLLIFLEGLWLTKILSMISHLLDTYGYKSSSNLVRNLFLLFTQKIPVIALNFPALVLAFFHLFVSIFALKIYFQWSNRHFARFFLILYFLFLLVSLALIILSASHAPFFKVWEDFITLFLSPFPLIFIAIMVKLAKKT